MNLDYNVAAMLAYLPICCINLVFSIIWIATEPKENRFLRFHAIQSLIFMIVAIAVGVVFWILQIAVFVGAGSGAAGVAAAGGFGLLALIRLVIGLGFLIVAILCCVKSYQGEMWKLPIIGDIAEKNS